MRKLKVVAFAFLVLVFVASPSLSVGEAEYKLEVKYRIENRGNRTYVLTPYDKTVVWSTNDSHQVLRLTEGRVKEIIFDEDENLVAILDVPNELAPGQSIEVELVYHASVRGREAPNVELHRSSTLDAIPSELKEAYASPIGVWQYDDWDHLREVADELAGNDTVVLRIVYKIIEWVGEEIEYKTGDPRYPNETYAWKRGDCDDQSNLLVTLCRCVGIPAYLQIGGLFMPAVGERTSTLWDGKLVIVERGVGFHGWAVVYIPPFGWLPVDMTYGYEKGDPETAIVKAALFQSTVVVLYNITKSDYIRESRIARELTYDYDLYREEEYHMEVLGHPTIKTRIPLATLGMVGLFTLAIAMATLYFWSTISRVPQVLDR